jgi:hypothetical protein
MAASGLNVLAGIWLIIAPFVLGYDDGDPYWNDIVFGSHTVRDNRRAAPEDGRRPRGARTSGRGRAVLADVGLPAVVRSTPEPVIPMTTHTDVFGAASESSHSASAASKAPSSRCARPVRVAPVVFGYAHIGGLSCP